MSPEFDPAPLIHALGLPAAWADEHGRLMVINEEFSRWAPAYARARLESRPEGAWLVSPGRNPLPMRAELLGTGHLIIPPTEGGRVALEAVVTSVVRRLDRVCATLEASMGAALRERPAEAVVTAVREALAAVEDLNSLRRQVLGLSPGVSQPEPTAVNLGTLVEEALAAMTGPLPVEFLYVARDCVVRAVREKCFWAIAAVVGTLARSVAGHGSILVEVRTRGEMGVLYFRCSSTAPTYGIEIDTARDAVEAAGGRLLVDPDAGVIMQFPIYVVLDAPPTTSGKGTLLIVDDDPSVLAMMGAVLRREGYMVLEADNGVSASSLLRTQGRQLTALITDAVLPGRSGVDIVTEARRWLPRLPVLMVTGHDEDLVGTQLAPVLRKPFGAKALRDRVAALISEKRG